MSEEKGSAPAEAQEMQPTYGSPEYIIASITEWINNYGGENTGSLLLYEAMQCVKRMAAAQKDAAAIRKAALNEAALLMDDLYEEAERLAETAEVLEQQRFAGMMHGFDIAQQRIQALKIDQQGEPQ